MNEPQRNRRSEYSDTREAQGAPSIRDLLAKNRTGEREVWSRSFHVRLNRPSECWRLVGLTEEEGAER